MSRLFWPVAAFVAGIVVCSVWFSGLLDASGVKIEVRPGLHQQSVVWRMPDGTRCVWTSPGRFPSPPDKTNVTCNR